MRAIIRPDLVELPAYRPGRKPADLGGEGLGRPLVKLSSNEIAFGPLPGVADAIRSCVAGVNRYPDFFGSDLVAVLGARAEVSANQVVLDNGSSALCLHAVEAVADRGDEVVLPWPSFEVYARAALLRGSRPVRVPLRGGIYHDLEAMAAAIGPRTKAVFVCGPNNPTGSAVDPDQLADFIARVPPNVLVVVDEAYREFAGDPASRPDAVPLLRRHPNLVVLRTFSKAYGLAGLRVGYAIANDAVADVLRKLAVPFAVSSLAQAAALASLAATVELERRVSALVEERERLTRTLRAGGIPVADSAGNFIWLPLGGEAVAFAQACERNGVLVRPFPPDGVRVTLGSPPENDRFLSAVADWRATTGGAGIPRTDLDHDPEDACARRE
ncbi:MAG: histidinol-phosphate transaminase [Acidimicrobiales bacterium]